MLFRLRVISGQTILKRNVQTLSKYFSKCNPGCYFATDDC